MKHGSRSLTDVDEELPGQQLAPVSHGVFPTTHWTSLLAPIRDRGQGAQAALERLCQVYRRPLVACAQHLLGQNAGEAEDVVHDYLCSLLRREDLARVHRQSGKFRSFLATGIRNQVLDLLRNRRAEKRGGGAPILSIDQMAIEPADLSTAEVVLCRSWLQASIDEVLRQLEDEWSAAGKRDEFRDLKDFALSRKSDVPRSELAARYGVSVNAVDARISRLRRRFREGLRELIGQTVSAPEEVDEEIRLLMTSLSG
jgi:RNA polymerase sigma-70 factor (ECF subfamily)